MRENKKNLLILIVAMLLVAAVFFVVIGRNKDPNEIVIQPQVNEEVAVFDTPGPATEIEQAADPTQTVTVEDQIPPTPRTGLESTDPATVNLASGDIQLIEVFAFW